jgi:hypothetical protein
MGIRWLGGLGGALVALFATSTASAFCGFYVGGSGEALYSNATHVALMREGTHTVLSMANNYQGPPEDFALVIPVPVVLQKPDVKTLPAELFDRLDQLTAPRLVEYWEQDPCPAAEQYGADDKEGGTGTRAKGEEGSMGMPGPSSVRVEAQFDVNEYQIVILSASESTGLDRWLRDNGYNIPEGAEAALRPYIERGSKFFVAKVNADKVKLEHGMVMLSPLRFHYDSERFELPIRLGLLNAREAQDLIVHVVARKNRFELANYPNVTIPTNIEVADLVRNDFAGFYATLFDATVAKTPKAVITEYAWDTSTCDPCPAPPLVDRELSLLGADALPSTAIRYGNLPPEEMVVELVKVEPEAMAQSAYKGAIWPGIEACYKAALTTDPNAQGRLTLALSIDAAGEVVEATAQPPAEPAAEQALSEGLSQCVLNRVRSSPVPPTDGADRPGAITLELRFDTEASAIGRVPPGGFDRDYVVTRLHARYDKKTLGEDLVFRTAEPIVGGREFRNAGVLEHGATKDRDGRNNFQARYMIRHQWDGPVTCKDPQYGRWGGPPGKARPQLTPARELAFASRGVVKLAEVARTSVPELGIVAEPRPLRPNETRPGETTAPKMEIFERDKLPLAGFLLGVLFAIGAALGARRLRAAEGE